MFAITATTRIKYRIYGNSLRFSTLYKYAAFRNRIEISCHLHKPVQVVMKFVQIGTLLDSYTRSIANLSLHFVLILLFRLVGLVVANVTAEQKVLGSIPIWIPIPIVGPSAIVLVLQKFLSSSYGVWICTRLQ